MPNSPLTRHNCDVCKKTFARLEHLRRHLKIHEDARPFGCQHCKKSFSRRDAATRHEQTHQRPSSGDGRKLSLRRACLACSTARVFCPGGNPCATCSSKGRECTYVRRRPRQHSAQKNHLLSPLDVQPLEEDTLSVVPLPAVPDVVTSSSSGPANYNVQSTSISTGSSRHAGHENPLSGPRSQGCQNGLTALNWLPFDSPNSAEQVDFSPQDASARCRNSFQQLSGDAEVPHSTPTASELQEAVDIPQSDTLTSLIASMGRASQAFGRGRHSALISGLSEVSNPVGSLYSDGTGGRSSQAERSMHNQRALRGRSELMNIDNNATSPKSDRSWLSTLETSLHDTPHLDNTRLYRIPPNIYSSIITKIDARIVCCSPKSSFLLSSCSFPRKDTLDHFVRLYFDHFHPTYPFLDLPLLNMPVWGWSLCLATATIGCQYSNSPAKDICRDALSVVLRETLVSEVSGPCAY